MVALGKNGISRLRLLGEFKVQGLEFGFTGCGVEGSGCGLSLSDRCGSGSPQV